MQRLLLVFACVLAVACSKNDEPPPPSSGSPNAQPESGPRRRPATGTPTSGGMSATEQAQQMFATVCVTCHGANGHGDGPAAAGLGSAKPRDYTDAAWQANVTDDEIRKAILGGGAAVGKSPMMPGNPQLKDKPEVVEVLVQIVRGFGKK